MAADGERTSEAFGRGNPTLRGKANERWPTPEASDGSGGRVSTELGGKRLSGARRAITLATAAVHVERGLWPTPKASPSGPDYAREGREGSGGDDLATAAARWLTPTSAPFSGGGGGGELSAQVNESGEREMYPTPTASRRSGLQSHGENVVSGALNPDWVEMLMMMPVGWTNRDVPNEDLVMLPSPVGPRETPPDYEPPRTLAAVPHRLPRLSAIGDSLVGLIPAILGGRVPR